MKYFCTETERKASKSTCYFEFQKGHHKGKHWLEDSISIHDDLLSDEIYQVFVAAIPQFDPFGVTEVTKEQWQQVKSRAETVGGEAIAAITEIEDWVVECFEEEEVFTICGI